MQKPSDYDSVQAYGEQPKLELGGHIMKIIKVEETTSKNGNEMIMIYLDTDKTDKQPGYFKQRYDNDTREDKKWGCIVYQLINDTQTGGTNPGLKTFHECVKKSNSSSFKLLWGDKYCDCFKGKLIGGVFGREQYINKKGKAAFATKCFFFRSVGVILEGVEVPEDKLLDENKLSKSPMVTPDPADFEDVSSDDDYPF